MSGDRLTPRPSPAIGPNGWRSALGEAEHLIPTLLGIAGALAPVALGYWRQEQPAVMQRIRRSSRLVADGARLSIDNAIVRGGRVYL
jgi:hypothetical protein